MIEYWIWLSYSLDAATMHFKPLLEKFKTPKDIYKAPISELQSLYLLSQAELKRLNNKALDKAYDIMKQCDDTKIDIVTYDSPEYPKNLKNISNPPVVLYRRGKLKDLNEIPLVCIIGARKVSDYGSKSAWSLAARLAAAKIVIVSGGAIGTDTAAHEGALAVGGKTVAIVPCGLNYDYLKTNDFLRKVIADSGCLISELPPDEPLRKNAFQVRNRIMSALASGVVVIEASAKSGTMITARYALEQGRDVFVVPGRPDDPNHEGSHQLLREGAIPVFNADDIFTEYLPHYPNIIDVDRAKSTNISALYRGFNSPKFFDDDKIIEEITPLSDKKVEKVKKNIEEGLPKNAEIVYNYLDKDIFTVDDLLFSDLSFEDVLAAVTQLELFGYIKALPGGRYAIIY